MALLFSLAVTVPVLAQAPDRALDTAPAAAADMAQLSDAPVVAKIERTEAADLFAARIAAAVTQNPRVLSSIAAQREAKQARREARAGYLPQVDFAITGNHSLSRRFENQFDNIIERSRPRSRADATLTGTQLLFDGGATSARVDRAEAQISEAEQTVLDTAANVALEAAEVYHQVVQYQALLSIGEDYVARHKTILEKVRERYDNGFGALRDVARVEARLADAEARLATFERGFATAQSRYVELFGEPPPDLRRPQPLGSDAQSEDQAIELGVMNNPAIRAAEFNAEMAEQNYRALKADYYPSLSVAVDATKYNMFDDREDYDIRGRLVMNYNLFSGGAKTARVGQALQRWRQAQHDEDRVRQEVERRLAIAYRELHVLDRQYAMLKRAVDANNQARDIYLEQFRVARGSLLDVLQAEEDYFQAAVSYLNGFVETDMAHYTLLAETGELLGKLDIHLSFADAGDLFGGR